jgi:hypothetical protein
MGKNPSINYRYIAFIAFIAFITFIALTFAFITTRYTEHFQPLRADAAPTANPYYPGGIVTDTPTGFPEYIESPLSCLKNSYVRLLTSSIKTVGRGVGTMPIKAACPAGQRDDGTDCWEDVVNYGPVYIPSPGIAYIPSGIRTVPKGCCNGLPAIDGNNSIACESKARCTYAGGGAETDWINYPCTCTSSLCNVNSNYTDGRRDDLIGGLCYQLCPSGYDRNGLGCSIQTCPDGSTNVAGICRKGCGCIKTPLSNRLSCPDGQELCGGLCYPKCQTGYAPAGCNLCENSNTCDPLTQDHEPGVCYPKCQVNPPFTGIGSTCWSNAITHPRDSRVTLPKVINVEAKKIFHRDALFEGVSTPVPSC